MPIVFSYQPASGPLSGASFEAQTVAFFEALQAEFQGQLSSVSAQLTQLQQSVTALTATTQANAAAITALQQRCATIEATVAANTTELSQQGQQISDLSSTLSSVSGRVGTMENAVGALQTLTSQQGSSISTLQTDVQGLQSTTSSQGSSITSLQEQVTALEQGGSVPAGLIALYDGTTPPSGYKVCDGSNGTPDLAGFVASPLTYISKN